MRQHVTVGNRVETSVRLDPKVLLTSQLLQLSQVELELAIEAELTDNPALERLDPVEPSDPDDNLRGVAPELDRPPSEDREYLRSLPEPESTDWQDYAASPASLRDHLMAQILAVVPNHLHAAAEYVVESIDEKGYLTEAVEELALSTNTSMEDIQLVIHALHSCEPAGIGAHDVRECLMLQLSKSDQLEQRLGRSILRDYMDDFLQGRKMRIARRFGVMPELVESAFGAIRSCNPFPGEAFAPNRVRAPKSSSISAELELSRDETGWHVEVLGPDFTSLRISRAYQRRAKELERPDASLRDEKRHVTTMVERAKNFVDCLEQRRKTLRAIGHYLIEHQSGFVSTGSYDFLMPLTRMKLASDLGIHESTISRATNNKFIQIANGEIVPFETFFKPALRIQKMIEEILSTENPREPLSDERIAEMLAARGVDVARRTVNKYRDRTRLLSSRKRRSA